MPVARVFRLSRALRSVPLLALRGALALGAIGTLACTVKEVETSAAGGQGGASFGKAGSGPSAAGTSSGGTSSGGTSGGGTSGGGTSGGGASGGGTSGGGTSGSQGGASGSQGGTSASGGSSGGSPLAETKEAPTPFATEGLHVAPTGDDVTGNGTAAAPYRTVQHVLDEVAKPGSVVLLHAGTYQEQVRIRHSNLVLQAAPGEKAHITCPLSIDADDPTLCIEIDAETTGVTLRGLEVSGGFYSVFLGSQWDYDDTPLDNATARHVTIEDCVLHDSGRDTVKIPAGCDDVTIRRCEIYNSGMGYPPGFPEDEKNAEGIDAVNSDRLRVADTYIHDTATTCVYVKGGSIGAIIERVRAERCGELGIALGFDTSPEFFDTNANPGYYENIDGIVRNCLVRDTGFAGIGLFASRDAQVLHNTVIGTAKKGMAALYLGVATQDYAPEASRPANLRPIVFGNVVDQRAIAEPRCFGIRYTVEDSLGLLSGLSGPATIRNNLYYSGPSTCLFDDGRPDSLLEDGTFAAWQTHGAGYDAGSSLADPNLDASGRPAAGSPAVDALPTATPGVVLDLDGKPRAVPFDLGAFER